ncbi:SIR2 family protein [Intestinibacter bartlettii]|uniref:SIR2 family protein n=1 Tax=Intestinibacter bartlettii TaxID=261299 RepID=A0ABS6DX00_9FIRM|nr:SIR2 family protein [Intestinibacter bartlettii]MBU5336275.1 SIR2 family protein [Intestinibacter bartlettii]MDO5009838.1 SIR2 family protein [Intestinibacter bartlettii]
MNITIFLGAGASAAENLPIQNELFSQYFKYILPQNKNAKMNKELSKFFKDLFFIDVENQDVEKINFPTFEEVLGVLDLAEQKRESFKNYKSESYNDNNTSISYIRQSLIMLTAYALNNATRDSNSYHQLLLSNLVKEDLLKDTTFISANYDIHIDNAIANLYDEKSFPVMLNYGIDFANFNLSKNSWQRPIDPMVNLYKIHGSLNWLYCPICNSITITPYEGGVMRIIENIKQAKCLNCGELTVPIIVPPTYFKNMSNVFLSTVWNKSERALRESDILVFCGYSFPEADMHIKYLLKRVQTSRLKDNLKVIVVNNHSKKKHSLREKEKNRYERFLGKDVIYTEFSFEEFADDPKKIIDLAK